MIKQHVKFITTVQLMNFYNTCRGFDSEVNVRDIENKRLDVNGKCLQDMMSVQLGLPVCMVIHGSDEKKAVNILKKYTI